MSPQRIYFLLVLILGTALAACGNIDTPPVPAPSGTVPGETLPAVPITSTEAAPSPTPEPTATLTPPLALLLVPPESDPELAAALEAGLQPALEAAGWRWEARAALSPDELVADLRLVIVLAPDPGLAALLAANSPAQFLAVGLAGFQPAANLSLVGPQGLRGDQAGFIAGVAAAVMTLDWRVGILGPEDTPANRASRQGFLNGAIYFCGLCLPYHGPSVDYPVYLGLPTGAGAADIQAAVQGLNDLAVKTVYLPPGVGSTDLYLALGQAGIKIIGSEAAPQASAANWVASVRADPLPVVLELLPSLLAGEGGFNRDVPFVLQDVNPSLLSEGKQLYLQEVMEDLQSGYIDTGVDPLTGDSQ